MTLPELLDHHQIVYRKGFRSGEIYICCPFCEERGEPSPDTKFRLGTNYVTDEGHCFRCDWSIGKGIGKAVDTIINALLQAPVTVRRGKQEEDDSEEEKIALPEDFELLHEISKIDEVGYQAVRYMRKRGFRRSMMRKKGIGVSLTGRYAYRVIFPVYWKGELKSIVARDFTNTKPAKYLNSPGMKFLYNMPDRTDRIVLAEGAIKALAIERVIKEPAAALLGHNITDNMTQQLHSAKVKEVVLWSDPDWIGIRGVTEIAHTLVDSFDVSMIFPFPEKQADDMTREEIQTAFDKRQIVDLKLVKKLEAKVKHAIAFQSGR